MNENAHDANWSGRTSEWIGHVKRLENEERLACDMEHFLGHDDPGLRAMIREARS